LFISSCCTIILVERVQMALHRKKWVNPFSSQEVGVLGAHQILHHHISTAQKATVGRTQFFVAIGIARANLYFKMWTTHNPCSAKDQKNITTQWCSTGRHLTAATHALHTSCGKLNSTEKKGNPTEIIACLGKTYAGVPW